MSVKPKDEKPSTSSSIVGCCQSSTTTPDNSVIDYIEEDLEAPNNNTQFHASDAMKDAAIENATIDIMNQKKDSVNFTFPKRPKVDIEFKKVRFTVKKFSIQQREFRKYLNNLMHLISGSVFF